MTEGRLVAFSVTFLAIYESSWSEILELKIPAFKGIQLSFYIIDLSFIENNAFNSPDFKNLIIIVYLYFLPRIE